MLFLSSLSDAAIWPSFAWPDYPGQIIDMLRDWTAPMIDTSGKCDLCLPLDEHFDERLSIIRTQQSKRQWGLCLDCILAGEIRHETCRTEHLKDIS